MFIENKYYTWYKKLTSTNYTGIGYTEVHHIIPRSMGGDNSESNLVKLSYRQHFIAHKLLVRCTDGKDKHKMILAVWGMVNQLNEGRTLFNSKDYAYAKELYIKSISGGNHWAKTLSFKEKVSRQWTDERKASHREKVSGDNHWTKDAKFAQSKQNSLEAMKKGREANIDRLKEIWRKKSTENNAMKNPEVAKKLKVPKEKVTCPHCNLTGGKPVMIRYHFDKCKNQ